MCVCACQGMGIASRQMDEALKEVLVCVCLNHSALSQHGALGQPEDMNKCTMRECIQVTQSNIDH